MKRRRTLAIFLLLFLLNCSAISGEDKRIFELRTYYANPEKLDQLHARFRNHTVALFKKHKMTNVGYWVPVENSENRLIYLMAYPNRDERDKMWKAFKNDPVWKKAYADSTKEGKLISKVESLFLAATDYSPELKIETASPERLFELRIYTTNLGKLEGLNARFRDHTVRLFEKHGLSNIAYFSPVEGQPGAGIKLIYFLAHKDVDSRAAGFKAFSGDPKWKSAREASEKDGKLLVKKGVSSTLLVPTDYSPMK